MRQRHKGLARDAITQKTGRPATIKGLSKQTAQATEAPPNPNKVKYLALLSLRALVGRGYLPNTGAETVRARSANVYSGTVSGAEIARRRAANKRARIARRAHRR